MPAPPLALIDEIGIDVAWHILKESEKDNNSPKPDAQVMALVDQLYQAGRLGRKTQ